MAAKVGFHGDDYKASISLEDFNRKHSQKHNSSSLQKAHTFHGIRRKYVPSLYHNPDPDLTHKLKDFLRKPPLNSPEYFKYLQKKRMSLCSADNPSREETRRTSLPANDKLSEKLKHLKPERRTIQEMILPPISDGCKENFSNLYKSPSPGPFVGSSVGPIEQLKYCQYIRPRPKFDRKTCWS